MHQPRDRDPPWRHTRARAASLYRRDSRNPERHHAPSPPVERLPPGRRLRRGPPKRPSCAGASVRRPALALACLTASTAVALTAATAPLAAQGIEGKIGRFYDDDGWTIYRLGLRRPLLGPIGTTFHGDYLERVGDGKGAFAGLGFDVTAFQGGAPGPYVVAGIGAGMGSPHSRSFSSTWTGWS